MGSSGSSGAGAGGAGAGTDLASSDTTGGLKSSGI